MWYYKNTMNPISRETTARLLETVQRAVPLEPRPFLSIAQQLSLSEQEVIRALRQFKAESIIREISAVFDPAMLGYRAALAAFRVDDERLADVARIVSEHPGVSHCYSRDSSVNLWFTITVGPEQDLEIEFARLAAADGVQEAHLLPALKVYKIGVFLPMTETGAPVAVAQRKLSAPRPLTPREKAVARALQNDLPLISNPFAELAKDSGLTEAELLECARTLLDRGVIRRYAAVLRHREAGYLANAMVCWKAPREAIDDAGRKLAADPAVSHCYRRPAWPGWPYELYTMIHERNEERLDAAIKRLAEASGLREMKILRTVTEFKKTRVRYL